jgi:quinol monooxygenase YgiN
MLVIAGEIEIDPAHHDAAVAAAKRVQEATRKEAGCHAYVFSADLAEPGRFRLFEEWASPEALAAHFGQPHMAEFQKAIASVGVRRMDVARYEIAKKGPLR